ncbi:AbrB/MazE/SpoVT family DNA-binding domain-containing protein [Hymenobacter glacialis]|uniref:SpoVT-AbrB domain-containing protein n=1 Tax=Hymenobacter glacialis TaxID=1908236 RepID=A0A1G1T3E3_9BACT|nr:AbrB/MazE/SpoVT family DNA-binding domain-containing protein [Hymenobacter glacialis]OGX85385.1 hypothetical protein BEN48_14570 [Hymenobacter glacialis]
MNTRLIRVGNSQGIVLPRKLLQQYHLVGEVDLQPTAEGLLIKPVVKRRRQGWDERFQQALAQRPAPEGELLEVFSDDSFEDTQWEW